MMKRINIFTIYALILMCGICSSCGIMVKNYALSNISLENKSIPPNFGIDNSILLCALFDENSSGNSIYDKYIAKYNRKIETQVRQVYKGKYEFISISDENSVKFDNKNKYRFLFHSEILSIHDTKDLNLSNFFYVQDRKENKIYKLSFSYKNYKKVVQAYMIKLEKERKKYHE